MAAKNGNLVTKITSAADTASKRAAATNAQADSLIATATELRAEAKGDARRAEGFAKMLAVAEEYGITGV